MKRLVIQLFDRLAGPVLKALDKINFRRHPAKVGKILICRLDHIGDVVMTTPAFNAIKAKFPEAQVFVLSNAAGISILRGNPYVDGYYLFNWPWPYDNKNNRFTRKHLQDAYRLVREIKKQQFDLFVDFRGDIRFLLFWGWLTRIPIRLFYNRMGGRSLATASFPHEKGIHEVERVQRTLSVIGVDVPKLRPEVFLSADECASIDLFIKDKNRRYVVVSPFAAKSVKEWRIEHWSKIVGYIQHKFDLDIYIIGTRENFEKAELICAENKGSYNICGATSLRQAAALMEKSAMVVGVDTGTLHIAACFDIPIISIFGPTDAKQYRPYSPYSTVIDLNVCACDKDKHLVCFENRSGVASCLDKIAVSMVCNNIDAVISHNFRYA